MKSKTLRLGLIVMLLAAITISIISGTLAKYVKTVTAADKARVAKFEYTVDGLDEEKQTINIFNTANDTGIIGNQTNEKLVAPGTQGSFEIVFTNKSEVLVKAGYTLTETNTNIPVVYGYDNKYYSSVLPAGTSVTIHEGEAAITVEGELDKLAAAIGEAIEIANGETKEIEVTWAWAFIGDGTVQSDDTDRTLGETGTATVELQVNCDITQVDTKTI